MQWRHISSWAESVSTRTLNPRLWRGVVVLSCAMLVALAAHAASQSAALTDQNSAPSPVSPLSCQLGPNQTKHQAPLTKNKTVKPGNAFGLRSQRNPFPNPVAVSQTSLPQSLSHKATGPRSRLTPLLQAGALDLRSVYLRGCALLI